MGYMVRKEKDGLHGEEREGGLHGEEREGWVT